MLQGSQDDGWLESTAPWKIYKPQGAVYKEVGWNKVRDIWFEYVG